MSPMFFILMRILYPFDKVARVRELMRALIRLTISWVSAPEDVESFAYWAEDRAKLEGHIAALEYSMRCLVWDRARQLLGLPYISHRRQRDPKIRNPKSMTQLFKRLDQLAHDHDNLDKLASRLADKMKREGATLSPSLRDSPLRLDAAHQSTSPGSAGGGLTTYTALEVLPRQRRGRWRAHTCARDGGGCASSRGSAFARGPPPLPTPHSQLPHLSAPRLRSHPHARNIPKSSSHIARAVAHPKKQAYDPMHDHPRQSPST